MRMTLEISKEIKERIHKIRQRMELKSDIEVIAKALTLYEFLSEEVTKGNKVILVDEIGESEEVEIV